MQVHQSVKVIAEASEHFGRAGIIESLTAKKAVVVLDADATREKQTETFDRTALQLL